MLYLGEKNNFIVISCNGDYDVTTEATLRPGAATEAAEAGGWSIAPKEEMGYSKQVTEDQSKLLEVEARMEC